MNADGVCDFINEARAGAGLDALLQPTDENELREVSFVEVEFIKEKSETDIVPEGEEITIKEILENALVGQIKEGLEESLSSAMTAVPTHIEIDWNTIEEGDETPKISAKIRLYNKYLNNEASGQFIGGDLVIQGQCSSSKYGPALCKVSFASDDEEEYKEITTIDPNAMMFTSAEGEDIPATYAIPISIDSTLSGTAKVEIFVAPVDKISYTVVVDEEKNGDENTSRSLDPSEMIKAIDLKVRTSTDEGDTRGDALQEESKVSISRKYLKSLRLVLDATEAETLQSEEGYEKCVILQETSTVGDGATKPFFMLASFADEGDESLLEDAIFVRSPKTEGEGESDKVPETSNSVPEGYELMTSCNISIDETYTLQLAIKNGPSGGFSRASLISYPAGSDEMLKEYLDAIGGGELRMLPEIISNLTEPTAESTAEPVEGEETTTTATVATGQPLIGLVLLSKLNDATAVVDTEVELKATEVTTTNPIDMNVEGIESKEGDDDGNIMTTDNDDNLSQVTNDQDPGVDLEASSVEANREAEIAELRFKLESMQDVLRNARERHGESQKKTAALLARQNQQANAAMGGRQAAAEETTESAAEVENNAEKEKHFNDTLKLIAAARMRLRKQQGEFDQLALDLQVRLDDKEFRALEIAETFREFKREILAKAEHSRTNKPLSKRVIKEFEEDEKRKDDELERVRLRNISLRTQLRKVERTLKAKEQLAEGLHMIDFEQLKIENQTLNEKIEERNEELGKLKHKKTLTVQVLTHIREKLRFVQQEIDGVREVMGEIDADINGQRATLASLKRERDVLKNENAELRRLQGFATSDLLLTDFDDRKTALESAKATVRELRDRHRMLSEQIEKNETQTANNLRSKSGALILPTIRK